MHEPVPKRKNFAAVLAVLVLIAVVNREPSAFAQTPKPPTIEQSFNDARLVADVIIDDARPISHGSEICGTAYSAIVKETFKDQGRFVKETHVTFGRLSGLIVGKEYLIFANQIATPEETCEALLKDPDQRLQELIAKTPKEEALDIIRCNGLVPGLIVTPDFYAPDGAWQFDEHGVDIEGLLPEPVPPSIHIDKPGPIYQYYLRREDVLAYLRSLGAPSLSDTSIKP